MGTNETKLLGTTKQLVTGLKAKEKSPVRYGVYLINDDYTPMDFVILVLQTYFAMPLESAVEVMLNVHHKGQGQCGIYTKDIAETKVAQVSSYAQEHQYPLLCQMKEI